MLLLKSNAIHFLFFFFFHLNKLCTIFSVWSFLGEAVEEETSASEDSEGSAHDGGPPGDSGQCFVPVVPQQRC